MLFRRVPRRELFLYRKLNVLALVIVIATGVYDYFRHWRPELSFEQFFSATVAVMVLQTIVTFLMIMPIVTTLVLLREGGRHRTLGVLVVLMLATAGYGYWSTRHAHTMTILTWERLKERTRYARAALIECEILHPAPLHPGATETCIRHDPDVIAMADALKAASKETSYPDAVAAARDKLTSYYKPDEAAGFRLHVDGSLVVLYAKYGRKPAIWLGYANKRFIVHAYQLPPRVRAILDL